MADMFVFTLCYLCWQLKSILCEVFGWRENNFLLVLHSTMLVSYHVRGKIMKTTKTHKALSIFKALLHNIGSEKETLQSSEPTEEDTKH